MWRSKRRSRWRRATLDHGPRDRLHRRASGKSTAKDDKGLPVHAQTFEQKMGALQAAYPQDDEAAIFHALSLAITAPKTEQDVLPINGNAARSSNPFSPSSHITRASRTTSSTATTSCTGRKRPGRGSPIRQGLRPRSAHANPHAFASVHARGLLGRVHQFQPQVGGTGGCG